MPFIQSANLCQVITTNSQSQQPRDLRRRSTATRLLQSWVRIPLGAWMFVCCECCVLSGRGLCDELITRPEESYRLWCIIVCDLETSRMWRPWSALGCSTTGWGGDTMKNSSNFKEGKITINSKNSRPNIMHVHKTLDTKICNNL